MNANGHIKPFWDDSYKFLSYINEIIKQPDLQKRWLDAGHCAENLVIETYAQPNPMPQWVSDIEKYWPEYKDFGYSFHKFSPGRYLPDHRDAYGKYKEKFNISLDQVVRILVYLEDWKPGQINTVEDTILTHWQAGDWIAWRGNTLHSVVNFGVDNRYALAITCHI